MGLETIAAIVGIAGGLTSMGSAIHGMTSGSGKKTSTSASTAATETEEQKAAKKKTAIAALAKESEQASGTSSGLAGSETANVTRKTLLGL